jgi:hypothetical protein
MSADLDHVRALHLMQQRKRECLNYAVLDGFISASISLAVAGGLSWSLQKSSDVSVCVASVGGHSSPYAHEALLRGSGAIVVPWSAYATQSKAA